MKNTKHKHTPLFVDSVREVAGCNGDIAIVDEKRSLVAVVYTHPEALERAEFIVRAANEYEHHVKTITHHLEKGEKRLEQIDELVNQNKALLEAAKGLLESIREEQIDNHQLADYTEGFNKAVYALQDAIAQAEGK